MLQRTICIDKIYPTRPITANCSDYGLKEERIEVIHSGISMHYEKYEHEGKLMNTNIKTAPHIIAISKAVQFHGLIVLADRNWKWQTCFLARSNNNKQLCNEYVYLYCTLHNKSHALSILSTYYWRLLHTGKCNFVHGRQCWKHIGRRRHVNTCYISIPLHTVCALNSTLIIPHT